MSEDCTVDEVEIVDLEEYTCSGRPIPKRVKYYLIKIDEDKYRVQSPITAKDILLVADLDPSDYLLEQHLKCGGTEALELSDLIDLRESGVERFTSIVARSITIIVNARERLVNKRRLTFTEVYHLAFDNPPTGESVCFTVTYENGPRNKPEGSMVEGSSIKVKNGMIFDVTATDKS